MRHGEATRLAARRTLSHQIVQLGVESLPLELRLLGRRSHAGPRQVLGKLLGKLRASMGSLKLCDGSLEPGPAPLGVVRDPKGRKSRLRSGPNGALLSDTEEIGLAVIVRRPHIVLV